MPSLRDRRRGYDADPAKRRARAERFRERGPQKENLANVQYGSARADCGMERWPQPMDGKAAYWFRHAFRSWLLTKVNRALPPSLPPTNQRGLSLRRLPFPSWLVSEGNVTAEAGPSEHGGESNGD